MCAYFPYPAKVWLNGHEWAQRQATQCGLAFRSLSNGFAECDDPAALQAICNRLGPAQIQAFAQRWMSQLPMPLGPEDRAAGYDWELSMRQIEVSRTVVFEAPRQARAFFEALIADNLDIGRPESMQIIFGRKIRRDTHREFRTSIKRPAIDPDNAGVALNLFYKHSRIKQYLKDGRALRIDAVINAPGDLGCKARLHNLTALQQKARACNRRILETQRVGQGCVLASSAFERMAHPVSMHRGGEPRRYASAILGSWP